MGTTLTSTKIKDTYKSLVKISDNSEAGSTGKQLSDGNGNDLGLYVDTDGVFGIGGAATYSLDISSKNDGLRVPNGTTVQRPTGAAGLIRYNTTTSKLELYDSSFKNIASESYVNSEVTTAINNLVDSSPGTLDTLNELAAALNDDPDFYNTITGLINAKQDTITGAATTITGSDLTASRAVISNASGKVAVSAVTDTELGYLDGVTSAIQTQIDGKQDTLTAGTGIDITSDTISADLTGLVDTGAIQGDAVTAPKIAQFDDNLTAATAGDILISDGTDFTDVTVSGDITITSAGVTTIGNDKIDSQHYVDGSIDNAHLAADSVNGAKIADDSIDSEHYVDGSIDTAHIADDQVTAAKLEHDINLPGTGSVGIPAGTTAQRPGTPAAGMFRYNTTDGQFEGYTTEWGAIAGSGDGGGSGTLDIEQDTFNGDGSTTAFTLTSSCDSENNTQVYIDGVYQSKDNYSVSGTTLTFTTAPPTGTSNVEVMHFKSVVGKVQVNTFTGDGSDTTFDVSNSISNENNTQVYLDGVYQSKDNYSTSGTTITFSTAPGNGVAIEVIHVVPNASGTGVDWQATAKTAAFTASAGEGYFVDTSSSAITVTLPSSPTAGDVVHLVDYAGNAATNKITITSSDDIMDSAADKVIDYDNGAVQLVYSGSTKGWLVASAANETATALGGASFDIDFLVVAGGGGGGGDMGGGGGAGGLRTSYGSTSGGGATAETAIEAFVSTDYTVTVGSGGTKGSGTYTNNATSGSNSVFSTITSTGGGKGAARTGYGNSNAGATGGSGGGGSGFAGGGVGGAGGAGTANQGYAGGTGGSYSAIDGGGGGGGAAEVGENATSGNSVTNGGDGLAVAITGTSTYYAGGGAANGTGSGGQGGGGDNQSNATANTGGGGGGAYSSQTAGNGGSGVVILRYPNSRTITVGAGLTSSNSTDGSYKVTTFTAGTGTISFS